MKLSPGMTIPDFPCLTLEGPVESFRSTLSAPRTALYLHRFSGCRVCFFAGCFSISSFHLFFSARQHPKRLRQRPM